jgi:glycosyltransferase involved in cell wall biosynthesis
MAVMHFEPHGGVADQMTTLAQQLPQYGLRPILVVRNPLSPEHPYAHLLKQQGICLWAVTARQYDIVKRGVQLLATLLLPVALADAVLQHKSLARARKSVWGVLRRTGYLGLDLLFLARLAWARARYHASAAHFRKPDSWFLIPWAARLGYCIIYTEDTEPRPETEPYYQGLGQVAFAIQAFSAVSTASAQHLQRYIGEDRKVMVIPNMVERPTEVVASHRSIRPFTIGFLGRLAPPKNVGLLLEAAQVFLELEDAQLLLFGDGPLLHDLYAQTTTLGIADKVHFMGAFTHAELPQIMAQIDLLVLPSLWEGFGVVLVEGMAYGKPCVATAVGGVPEVAVDGLTGLLVPPDDPQALATAIRRLIEDKILYVAFAHAARERFESCYTPERIAPQYAQLYENLKTYER